MKFTGQFQKKPAASSTRMPFSTGMFRSRLFSAPEAQRFPSTASSERRQPDYNRIFGVQPKLTVGAPNDHYEQEADRVADQVMSMPDKPIQRMDNLEEDEIQTKPLAGSISSLVQREDNLEEEDIQTKALGNADIQREAMPEEEELQTKAIDSIQREEMPEEEEIQTKSSGSIQREDIPEEEEIQTKAIDRSIQREEMPEEDEDLQMKSLGSIQREDNLEEEEIQTKPTLQRSTDGSLQAGGSIESQLNSSKGGGSPLPDEVRSFMEPRFSADFSQVRVHTDSEAVQMNRDLNAQAFTHKQDVYFGAGKAPGKDALTAHELTHVVQQTETVQRKCPACQEEEQVMRQVEESSSSKSSGSNASRNASQSSNTTGKLLDLITHLEQLHSHSNQQIGSQKETGSPDNIALKEEGHQHLNTLSQGLEQLQAVAASDDEALKQRVLAAFSSSAMQTAQAEASNRIQAASGLTLQSDTNVVVQRTPVGIATKSLTVSSEQDAAEIEANQIAKAVISDQPVTVNQHSSSSNINLFAGGETLIAIGSSLLAADAEAAPVEAAAGPPGWAVGLGIAAVGAVAIGVGIAIGGSKPDSEPITDSAPVPAPGTSAPPIPVPVPVPQARRWPNQTCENEVLDQLQKEMHRICDAIPGDSCNPSKVSKKKLAKRPCSQIRARIQAFRACLAARQRVQDECFGGKPDSIHDDVFEQVNNGLKSCLALEAINCAPGHPMANL